MTYNVYINDEFITASAGHLLKVDVIDNGKKINSNLSLPRSTKAREAVNESSLDWISVEDLYNLSNYTLLSNWHKITKIEKLTESEVRCIQTNTGHYLIKDFIYHNTVLPGIIQNNPLSIDTLVEVKE